MGNLSFSEISSLLLPLFAGLGLFLYGMKMLSDGLEKSAGNKLEKIIETLSGNIFKGVLLGGIVTVILQSSTATTVMMVGFVNAGIMNLSQAIGIIMGANIGTTFSTLVVALNLSNLAPIAIVSGMILKIFVKKGRAAIMGEVLLGFGILFFGMDVMQDAMRPLRTSEGFQNVILGIGTGGFIPIMKGFLVGIVITAIVQSSSATTALLVSLATVGALPIEAALPILYGSNVGTCVTAMISSAGASRTAKRAAWMHLIFNIIGAIIFILFFTGLTMSAVKILTDAAQLQLAYAHIIFNVTNTLILLPFAGLLVKAVERILPESQEERDEAELQKALHHTRYLDDRILEAPSVAISQVVKEVVHMGEMAKVSLEYAVNAAQENDERLAKKTFKIEKKINDMEHEISEFLVKLSNTAINDSDRQMIDGLFNTINDIERVGDHADNIAELAIFKIENNVQYSEKALLEMQEMVDKVMEAYDYSISALKQGNLQFAKKSIELEGVVDAMEKTLRKKHIRRLNEGRCETSSGIIFLDVISNLERVSDHASNIALSVLDIKSH